MGQIWTRAKWNDIIERINSLSQNPPEGCEALAPLVEVPEGHKWSVADIVNIRDRLSAICNENIFSAELVKWKQNIIDEIEIAIANGWCGCDLWAGPYSIEFPPDETFRDYPPITEQYDMGSMLCGGQWQNNVTMTYYEHSWGTGGFWLPTSLQVGPPGITGRFAKLRAIGTATGYPEGGTYPYSAERNLGPVDEDGWLHINDEVSLGYSAMDQRWTYDSGCSEWNENYSHGNTCSISESYLLIDRN
jgi:hypothetical protein